MSQDKPVLTRFWDKTFRAPNGCLEWTGAKSSTGYGDFYMDGRTQRAHRVSYLLCKGAIPLGLEVDHLCRNRICVDPDHLEVVTRKENVHRGIAPSAQNVKKIACPLGHPYQGANLYINSNGTRECLTCRREHGRIYDRNYAEKRKARRQANAAR